MGRVAPMTATTKPITKPRPSFVLELRPEPGVDPVLALRSLLKAALRRFGLRCVSLKEQHDEEEIHHADPDTQPRLPAFNYSQIRREKSPQSGRDDSSTRRSSHGEMKMSLGKRKGSGDIAELIKFDARSGTLYRCDRARAPDGEWYTEQKNITDNFSAVFDMENVEVGWIAFSSGGPPSFVMFPVGSDIGNPPSDKHKQGFRLRLKLAKGSGGGVREFASTAASTWQAIDKLHTEFEKERGKHAGKLPLVKLAAVRPSKTPMGTSYVPLFEITAWVVRPAELTTAPPAVADPAEDAPDFDDEVAA
jgi:hypothetical protein